MTDEEKKAIDYLQLCYDLSTITNESLSKLGIVLNLIEKQSKEIEELKENNKILKNLQNDTSRLYIEMIERKNYFERKLEKLEDKIKAKIEESELLIDNSQGCMSDEDLYKEYGKIEFEQSLLEKE